MALEMKTYITTPGKKCVKSTENGYFDICLVKKYQSVIIEIYLPSGISQSSHPAINSTGLLRCALF